MAFYYETIFLKNGESIAAGLTREAFIEAGWKEHKMFLREQIMQELRIFS
jgi:hypothetical protein